MAVHAGKRAEWWFGKRTSKEPGTEAGTDAQGRWGKVSGTKRWFSYDWWFGHHFDRDSAGKFGDDDHAKRRASFGKPTQLGQRARTKAPAAARMKRAKDDYADYLHERFLAAEGATNGYMVTPAGRAKGYSGADFFNIDTRRRPSMKWATDELRAWFGHGSAAAGTKGARGGVLSFKAWQEQTQERAA